MEKKNNKYLFGAVKVGEKGQIVIPKEARQIFDINTGDQLIVLGDYNEGLALIKSNDLTKFAKSILDSVKEND